MGFTITGPNSFLASGHPSAENVSPDRPPHLGLIRSTDAGTTWKTISQDGTADFHSIQLAGENLYAFDSQTSKVWRSVDGGATWTATGKLPGQAAAFTAVDRRRLLAALDNGTVLESKDGGRTFVTAYTPAR
ncbi:hypothetical protein AB0F17_63635 [Nonomuraea sp. NPDC026600]|uniref:WD40/YVTN/BNR-like repeat-containing protein n=1 Tax=Nonomuraea sp. NPDC026600 TaxID=3155363 RepID=UPI0033D93DFB